MRTVCKTMEGLSPCSFISPSVSILILCIIYFNNTYRSGNDEKIRNKNPAYLPNYVRQCILSSLKVIIFIL